MYSVQQIARDILHYWFTQPYLTFFQQSEQHDDILRNKFGKYFNMSGLYHLPWDTNARTFLCYILILDQFPRHFYRGTARAYACDPLAVSFLLKHYKRFLHQLTSTQKLFALLPLQHSEHLGHQQLGCRIIIKLLDKHPRDKVLQDMLHHQRGHYRVIKVYGRFPKRNQFIETRKNTKKETLYLATADPKLPY